MDKTRKKWICCCGLTIMAPNNPTNIYSEERVDGHICSFVPEQFQLLFQLLKGDKMNIQLRASTTSEKKTDLMREYEVKDIEMIDKDTIAYIV